MNQGNVEHGEQTIDPRLIARVTREVIARLSDHAANGPANNGPANNGPAANDPANSGPARNGDVDAKERSVKVHDRVITARTVQAIDRGVTEVVTDAKAVITPAARDEATSRGITFRDHGELSSVPKPVASDATFSITDPQQPQRAQAIVQQLVSRGISQLSVAVVLSETPSREVHAQCCQHGQRAVMVTSLPDVDRFAKELDPTVWVLDMARVTFTAAVNIIARIAVRTA